MLVRPHQRRFPSTPLGRNVLVDAAAHTQTHAHVHIHIQYTYTCTHSIDNFASSFFRHIHQNLIHLCYNERCSVALCCNKSSLFSAARICYSSSSSPCRIRSHSDSDSDLESRRPARRVFRCFPLAWRGARRSPLHRSAAQLHHLKFELRAPLMFSIQCYSNSFSLLDARSLPSGRSVSRLWRLASVSSTCNPQSAILVCLAHATRRASAPCRVCFASPI